MKEIGRSGKKWEKTKICDFSFNRSTWLRHRVAIVPHCLNFLAKFGDVVHAPRLGAIEQRAVELEGCVVYGVLCVVRCGVVGEGGCEGVRV